MYYAIFVKPSLFCNIGAICLYWYIEEQLLFMPHKVNKLNSSWYDFTTFSVHVNYEWNICTNHTLISTWKACVKCFIQVLIWTNHFGNLFGKCCKTQSGLESWKFSIRWHWMKGILPMCIVCQFTMMCLHWLWPNQSTKLLVDYWVKCVKGYKY